MLARHPHSSLPPYSATPCALPTPPPCTHLVVSSQHHTHGLGDDAQVGGEPHEQLMEEQHGGPGDGVVLPRGGDGGSSVGAS